MLQKRANVSIWLSVSSPFNVPWVNHKTIFTPKNCFSCCSVWCKIAFSSVFANKLSQLLRLFWFKRQFFVVKIVLWPSLSILPPSKTKFIFSIGIGVKAPNWCNKGVMLLSKSKAYFSPQALNWKFNILYYFK